VPDPTRPKRVDSLAALSGSGGQPDSHVVVSAIPDTIRRGLVRRAVPLFGSILALAAPARAAPTIPHELAGLIDDTATLRSVRLHAVSHTMGDHALLVWEEDRDSGDDGRALARGERVTQQLTTHLLAAGADSRTVLLRVALSTITRVRTRKGVRETRDSARAEFADRNADGVLELILTRSAGRGPRERVYQARAGGLHLVHAALVACPRGAAGAVPLTVPPGAEATPATIAAIDRALGSAFEAAPGALRCALWDSLLAHAAPLPQPDVAVWVQPPPAGFRADAPARRGPARAIVWRSSKRSLARAVWRGGELELDHVRAEPDAALTWVDVAAVGDRLLALAVAGSGKKRGALLVDAVDDTILLSNPLRAGERPVFTDTNQDGELDFAVLRGRRRVAIYRRDRNGAWAPAS